MNASLLDEFPLEVCRPFLRFSEDRYTKTLLKRTPDYEIFLLCWKRGQSTAIHDHPPDGCWMRVLAGSLEEIEYECPSLRTLDCIRHSVGDHGFKRGSEVLHAIRALEDSVTIHVYYPPLYVARTYPPVDVQPTTDNPPNLPPNTHQSPPQNAPPETATLPTPENESSRVVHNNHVLSTTPPV